MHLYFKCSIKLILTFRWNIVEYFLVKIRCGWFSLLFTPEWCIYDGDDIGIVAAVVAVVYILWWQYKFSGFNPLDENKRWVNFKLDIVLNVKLLVSGCIACAYFLLSNTASFTLLIDLYIYWSISIKSNTHAAYRYMYV